MIDRRQNILWKHFRLFSIGLTALETEKPDQTAEEKSTLGIPYRDPTTTLDRRRQRLWVLLLFGGVLIPIFCHLIGAGGHPAPPDWQSGILGDKLAFALVMEAGYPLFPLLGYCIVSMSVYLFSSDQKKLAFAWKLGIYSGIFVAAWYWCLFGLTVVGKSTGLLGAILSNLVVTLVGAIIAAAIYLLIWSIDTSFRAQPYPQTYPPNENSKYAKIVLVLFFLFFFVTLVGTSGGGLFILFVGPLYFGVYWALFSYTYVSYRVFRDSSTLSKNFSLLQFLTTVTWIGTFLGLCRASVLASLAEYSKLPLEPPEGCYIATAASSGHSRFVGINEELCQAFPVNRQLCRLKAFELMLQTLAPPLHRGLRKAYNSAGPIAAGKIQNRFLADIAFVLLKPAEWFAMFCVRVVAGKKAGKLVLSVYRCRISKN